jgi:hypothetical protein
VALAISGLSAVALAGPAAADGPGSGTPWVATLGDSYISGEAGRWAGSSNTSSTYADALGSTAYFDNAANTAEQIARCHRSKSQESSIGGGVNGLNLACSGAKTSTYTSSDGYFKPGLDFADNGAGQQGQAKMLQTFAATHNVKMVVVGIGGNDFNFASIVQSCVSDFLASSSWFPDYCNDDSSVTANFTSANVSAVQTRIATALQNVRAAMRNAGYADSDLSVAHPEQCRIPVQPERIHPSEHGWLRILGQRRRLGQRHGTADDQRHGQERHHGLGCRRRQDSRSGLGLQRATAL